MARMNHDNEWLKNHAWRVLAVLACIALAIACFGCKAGLTLDSLPLPRPAPDAPAGPDALPGNIKWAGASYGSAAPDPRVELRSASLDQHKIYYDMTLPSGWPKRVVRVECQAIACFGYEENGKIVLGKYDWIRTGGQAVKETVNILDGYNGLRFPLPGTRCYAMLVSVDGKYRSKLVEMVWR